MTYDEHPPGKQPDDSVGIAGLLQPYVDGELTQEEAKEVAAYLERSDEARSEVRQQQEVRAALRSLAPEKAPDALRARVVSALERPANDAGGSGGWGKIFLLAVPAAAAAVALFVFAGAPGSLSKLADPIGGAHMDGAMQMAVPGATARGHAHDEAPTEPPPAPANHASRSDFVPQVAHTPALPEGFVFVGNPNAEATQTTFMYRNEHAGLRVLDDQRPARDSALAGHEQTFRGRTYTLARDAEGRPSVEFVRDGVHHRLSFEDGPRGVDDAVSTEAADFRHLLQVADALHERP